MMMTLQNQLIMFLQKLVENDLVTTVQLNFQEVLIIAQYLYRLVEFPTNTLTYKHVNI